MMNRRGLIKSSAFGLLAVSIPNIFYAKRIDHMLSENDSNPKIYQRYPSTDAELVADVVGSSHFDFDHVKNLVEKRPELARASWDWSFGDWESALGAASHVGRRDIANFLISKGARPNLFTYAMFGNFEIVKLMIETNPGIQRIQGPHGISLLGHVKAGLRDKKLSLKEKVQSERLLSYLTELGDADLSQNNIPMADEIKAKYLGDYMYGEGEKDGFSVKLNRRNLLSLGALGKFGGSLYQTSGNVFSYNGINSVKITFQEIEDKIVSMTITDPDMVVKAIKIQ